MIENIISAEQVEVKTFNDITTIDTFNKGKQWFIEVKFKGGTTAITSATQGEITQIEHDLRERGWQIDQSLFHSGFNAKPGNGLGRWSPRDPQGVRSVYPQGMRSAYAKRLWEMRADAAAIAGMDYDCDELPFASSADLWPDDYAIEAVRL